MSGYLFGFFYLGKESVEGWWWGVCFRKGGCFFVVLFVVNEIV